MFHVVIMRSCQEYKALVLSYALQPYYEESPIHLFCSLSSFSHLAGISGVGDEKIIKHLILQIVKKK